jgi:hypothetical protein
MRLAPGCIGHDADWQFPAITEQHAYLQAARRLTASDAAVYLAFPWATLIDRMHAVGSKAAAPLLDTLDRLAEHTRRYRTVATVCQHIKGLEYRTLFERAGVTDLFWSHANKDSAGKGDGTSVAIHPFPLYPVQRPAPDFDAEAADRPFLYSFAGARANQWYLTQSRNHILDLLRDDPRGLLRAREQWHFNKVVYDHQIRGKTADPKELLDEAAADEYRTILQRSVFSLCPSGTGPNTIRLWESIGFGAVPVVLADTYLPPGNPALWQQAAVFCAETPEAIRQLPDLLESIARDPAALREKRQALRQLWHVYGPEGFIHDVERLFVQRQFETLGTSALERSLPSRPLFEIASSLPALDGSERRCAVEVFISALGTRALLDASALDTDLQNHAELGDALHAALADAPHEQARRLRDLLAYKGIRSLPPTPPT